jgi:hypothetical protein
MKKWMEVPLIVAVAAATIVGTSAALQALNQPSSPVDAWLKAHMGQWWKRAQAAWNAGGNDAAVPSLENQAAPNAAGQTTQSAPVASPSSTDGGSFGLSATRAWSWTDSDTAMLRQVSRDLQDRLTADDWQHVLTWLTGDPDEAAKKLLALLKARLPASDWAWTEKKLGSGDAWAADIRLLQQAGWQWLDSLTPGERQWVLQRGEQLLSNYTKNAGGP